MKPDFRTILMVVEGVLFVALLVYGSAQSWSSSYSTGTLTGYLAGAMFVNEAIDRLLARASRRRSLHR